MYKVVKTNRAATTENGCKFKPLLTLADEYGGRAQLHYDDHCLVVDLKQSSGKYRRTPYIFREALEAIKTNNL